MAIDTLALGSIMPGLPVELAHFVAPRLADGSNDVSMTELRVLSEPGFVDDVDGSDATITRVARIVWRDSTGEVEHIWVRPGLRREGVATRLYDAALAITDGRLAISAWRTDDGEALAASIAARDGLTIPRRRRA